MSETYSFFMAALYIRINIHFEINSYMYNSRDWFEFFVSSILEIMCLIRSLYAFLNATSSLYFPLILVDEMNLYWKNGKKNKKIITFTGGKFMICFMICFSSCLYMFIFFYLDAIKPLFNRFICFFRIFIQMYCDWLLWNWLMW